MTRARRGEIWSVYTPGQPDDPHQPRPGLVVSDDSRNTLQDDLTVVPIFSSGRLGSTHLRLRAGLGGTRHDSILFCEEITTIVDEFLADGPLGPRVPTWILDAVLLGVRRALGEVVPER